MSWKNTPKKLVKSLRSKTQSFEYEKRIASLQNELAKTRDELGKVAYITKNRTTWPFGHFYSPQPDIEVIKTRESHLYDHVRRDFPGIDLNERGQLKLLRQLSQYYSDIPFKDTPSSDLRYHYSNPAYSYGDAIILHSMIRQIKPKRIIEVGSGFSSAVTLDTNELFFDNSIQTTFIEPYPELLYSLLKDGDAERITVIDEGLQLLDPRTFQQLEAGDILFIDSTHVSKIDSDVNKLFFEILPALKSGVHIHIHDVFNNFEYPKEWIYDGRAWQEDYILRAFLQYNDKFEVAMFNQFMLHFYEEYYKEHMPLCLKNGGGGFWMKKL